MNWLCIRQRMVIFWHSLSYDGVRFRSFSSGFISFSVLRSTLAYVLVRTRHQRFCACTKCFDVCQRKARRQNVRELNAVRTVCSSAVRQRFGTSTLAFVRLYCGHALTFLARTSYVLVTHQLQHSFNVICKSIRYLDGVRNFYLTLIV